MRRIATFALLLGIAVPAGADEPKPAAPAGKASAAKDLGPDVYAEALKDAGVPPGTLGFRKNGTWSRYPDAPYKLPFFDDLLADPTTTYEFTRTLGNAVEDLLTPERLRAAPEKDKPESLFSLGVLLATDRRIGGFRGFGFNLLEALPGPPPEETLFRLLLDHLPGSVWKAYMEADTAEGMSEAKDKIETELGNRLSAVPQALHDPLERLIRDLISAHVWIERGLRRVTTEQRKAVFGTLTDIVKTTPDGEKYFPVIEDVAREVDEHSLYYGCLKALAATQFARREFEAARPTDGWPTFRFELRTDLGVIRVGNSRTTPRGDEKEAAFLDVRLGRNRLWRPIGSTTAAQSLSVALLMDGAEEVGSSTAEPFDSIPLNPENHAVARGVLGCGIVYSAGDSGSVYQDESWGLGAGMFGVGALIDEGGDDTYRMDEVGEGAGYFGVGLLLDAAGNDKYELLAGDGQGYGGCNGIGILADRSGNDRYYAEPRPEKAGKERADYHSDQKIVGSNAQGCGSGRRGDVSDGHSWAGGLGALLDVEGDDVYEAGNFSQGCGYWFGTGLLYDGGGDDEYRSVYFSHASGAHFAVGCVVDESGNDLHSLSDWPKVGLGPKAGAGIAFGWDVVNAILIDRAGNDRYEADSISEGSADVRSNAWLIDEEGDDTYVLAVGAQGFADVDKLDNYATPGRTGTFPFHLSQSAFLFDLGGTDRYLRLSSPGGTPVPDSKAGDGLSWGTDGPRGPGGGWNVARGRDLAHGHVGWLDAWPRRAK